MQEKIKTQETPEEAANKIYHNTKHSYSVIPNYTNWIQGFINGAKWQQERMYSEEEVYDILIHHTVELFKKERITLEEFWNKFKKK